MVNANRGCLSSLDAQSQRLLGLRAGLNGPARSAATVARILRVGAQREALLEQMSLLALRTAASNGCGAQSTAGEPASAAQSGGTLVSTVATLPAAAATSAVNSTPGASSPSSSSSSNRGSQSTQGGSKGSSASPPLPAANLAGTTIAADATNDHQSLALALTVLGLLLAAVLMGRPWRRRGLFATTAAPVGGGSITPTPRAAEPVAPAAGAVATAASSRWAAPTATPAAEPPARGTPPSRWAAPVAPAAGPTAPKRDRPQPERPAATGQRAAPRVRKPALLTELPPREPRTPAPQDASWLREHATQAALVMTALAGATRVLARAVAKGSRRPRRR